MTDKILNALTVLRQRTAAGDLDAFVNWLSRIPEETSLFSVSVRRQIEEISAIDDTDEKARCIQEKINWHDEIRARCALSGQVLDYAAMKPGDETPLGEVVRVCPKCGRPGLVYDWGENCYHVAEHKEKILSGMASEPLDSCELDSGLPWDI